MAILDKIPASVLATRVIASVDASLARALKLKAGQNCIGMITSNCDDVTYVALDEATKAADVQVVYARSFYAGAAHASGPLSGEVIGILAGSGPADVTAGINRCREVIEYEAAFRAANDDGSLDVTTTPEDFTIVKETLAAAGLDTEVAEVTYNASMLAALDRDTAEKLLKMVDSLEDLDDVQEVYSNADISDEIMAELEG